MNMAFASPPNAFSITRPSRPTISDCPRRPMQTSPTIPNTTKTAITPYVPSSTSTTSNTTPMMMTSNNNNNNNNHSDDGMTSSNNSRTSSDNHNTIHLNTWVTKLLQASRLIGLSAAAVVTASVAPSLVNRMAGRREDIRPASIMHVIGKAEAAPQYSKKTLSEKLSQVPVFAVTNASGQPYLANMDGSGSQVGLIFFSHEDALNMLKDMQKNPGAADARVYIMGLDKAYEMVKAKPTPSGIRSSSGEELTMVFRFYPDSKQVKAAEGLARKLRLRSGVDGVPVFVAKGLTLRKGGENVVPLFLTKEDLDSAWSKLRETNKELPNSAQVVVGNLLFIIQQMENGETPELKNMGFFAPRASVEYVAKEQAGPVGQARLHQNPVNAQK